jgi:hypothetical protein
VTRRLGWLGSIGADPNDDAETQGRKALLVYLAVLIWPISILWGVLYLSLGAPAGTVAERLPAAQHVICRMPAALNESSGLLERFEVAAHAQNASCEARQGAPNRLNAPTMRM